jgi:acyl-coenzyme A thioesterase PaaI-like protein
MAIVVGFDVYGTLVDPFGMDRQRAEAQVINRGKNVGYVECEITSSDGKPVAKATSTCCVLREERSKQR